MALIQYNTPYYGYIYRGDATTGYREGVIGASDPIVGNTYRLSGAFSGELTNKVYKGLGNFCINNECTYALAKFEGGANTDLGDSGAPYFSFNSTGSQIKAMHVGRIGSTMYAHRWSDIVYWYGATIITI
jgi:hypothetical protein